MNLRAVLNILLYPLGYELSKLSAKPDAFHQQRRLLGSQPVRMVLDVGANVGQTASRYRRLFPDATIHCFEPFPESYGSLCQTHAGDKRVRAHPLAVAESAGQRTLYVSRGSQMNSLLPVAEGGDLHMGGRQAEVVAKTTVDVVTLDEFCRSEMIDHVDVLKMDVQGAELMVLRGATDLLQRQAIDIVFAEVLFADLYDDGVAFDQVWRYMERLGYTLYGLYNLTPGGNDFLGFGDAVFAAPRLLRERTASARAV